jgi:hypothetical protein
MPGLLDTTLPLFAEKRNKLLWVSCGRTSLVESIKRFSYVH